MAFLRTIQEVAIKMISSQTAKHKTRSKSRHRSEHLDDKFSRRIYLCGLPKYYSNRGKKMRLMLFQRSGLSNRGLTFRHLEMISVYFFLVLIGMNFVGGLNKGSLIIGYYVFMCFVAFIALYFLRKKKLFGELYQRVLFVMAFAFLSRIFILYFINLTPRGDYAGYLSVASELYNGLISNPKYYGVFPHALNYPLFLSGIYSIIGEHTWIPRGINLIIGVFEVGASAYIFNAIMSPFWGMLAGLVVALSPSSMLFTLLSGGESIYSGLIMCALCSFAVYQKAVKYRQLFLVFTSLLMAIANYFRPTSIVLLVAICIVFLFYERRKLMNTLIDMVCLIVPFLLVIVLFSALISSVSGYSHLQKGYGWNLYVGANQITNGTWNKEDGLIFQEKFLNNADPSAIQSYFFEQGVLRYQKMGGAVIKLFKNKIQLWSDESYLPYVVTHWQTLYTRFKSDGYQETFRVITNIYNIIFLTGAFFCIIISSMSDKVHVIVKTLSLYSIGSVILFLFIESAGRYKGGYYSIISALGIYGWYKMYTYIPILKALCGFSKRHTTDSEKKAN